MDRTISVALPKRVLRYLVAGFAVFFALVLASTSLGPVLVDAGVPLPDGPTALALLAALWLGLTVLWVRRMRGWEGSGSAWGAIPEEQYTGRFAEAGGIARHEWEKSIERLSGDGDDSD